VDKALTWFINCWVALFILANVVAAVGLFIGAKSFWDGCTQVWETFDPFNVGNYAVELAVLSPALIALYWRDNRRTRTP
jgi:hypothetical protein